LFANLVVTGRRRRRLALFVVILIVGAALSGCLGRPKLEDRWTRIDLLSTNVATMQATSVGATVPVSVRTQIIYRAIVTGYEVVELRTSSTFTPSNVAVRPDAPRLQMAMDIDRILANSVSGGRAIRAVTGWDHLMQTIDLSFTGVVPATGDTTGGATAGAFVLCYLASGVKIELPSGADTIVTTPLPSTNYQLLPIGVPLAVGP
jgi:hypothetical protein